MEISLELLKKRDSVEKTVSDGFMELHFDLNNGNVDVELQANQFQEHHKK